VHIWLPHNVLLGTEKDMDDIAVAIDKVARRLLGDDRAKAKDLAARTGKVWYESAEI
jgi:hypothetical protein